MNSQKYDVTQRNELLDEFLTPAELIEACFETSILPLFDQTATLHILDVGANDGRWGKAARRYFPNAHITGIELMDMPKPEGFDEWVTVDFIQLNFYSKYQLIIGNPPFTVKEPEGVDEDGKPKFKIIYKAEDFVRKALAILDKEGYLGFLLRSNFRHTIERHADLLKQHYPQFIYETNRRPSFYREDERTKYFGKKNTNAHDYSFFMWSHHWHNNWGVSIPLIWDYKESKK